MEFRHTKPIVVRQSGNISHKQDNNHFLILLTYSSHLPTPREILCSSLYSSPHFLFAILEHHIEFQKGLSSAINYLNFMQTS
ncbi:hypothetical protein EUGRSUZ_G02482 [Eucalyptus grandis]|uniref:Uncharacterized protein n=2 Tax=Eucalyptus grandis TaxID=71139 RepID=A0ACC3K8Q7_EUCGR|nr:hypothetical protein EUGRSUZ_G02482 [Eucalyptus grandis]